MAQGQLQQANLEQTALENKKLQQGLDDDQAMRRGWLDAGGDLDKLPGAIAGKVSGQTMLNVQKAITEHKEKMAKLSMDQLTNLQKGNDLIRQEGQGLLALKPEERPAAYLVSRKRLIDAGVPEADMPPVYDERFVLGGVNRSMQSAAFLNKEKDRREELLKIVPDNPEAWPAWYASLPADYQAVISPRHSKTEYERVRAIGSKPTASQAEDEARAEQIIAGIEAGDLPPTTQGLYRHGAAVKAGLARDKYDLSTAQLDWAATQRHLSALNSPQQLRFRQVAGQIVATTDQVEALFKRWQEVGTATGFKDFNKAGLEISSRLPGEMGSVANNLKALIADYTSELGQIYMGGNSPTDHALKLAEQNLKAEWNPQTFAEALKRIRESIQIRNNSLKHTGAAGLSGTTTYGQQPTPSAAPVQPTAPPATPPPQKLTDYVVNQANQAAPGDLTGPEPRVVPGAPTVGAPKYRTGQAVTRNGETWIYIGPGKGDDWREQKNWKRLQGFEAK